MFALGVLLACLLLYCGYIFLFGCGTKRKAEVLHSELRTLTGLPLHCVMYWIARKSPYHTRIIWLTTKAVHNDASIKRLHDVMQLWRLCCVQKRTVQFGFVLWLPKTKTAVVVCTNTHTLCTECNLGYWTIHYGLGNDVLLENSTDDPPQILYKDELPDNIKKTIEL